MEAAMNMNEQMGTVTESHRIADVAIAWFAPSSMTLTAVVDVVKLGPSTYAVEVQSPEGDALEQLLVEGLVGGKVDGRPLRGEDLQEVTFAAWPPRSVDDVTEWW